MNGYVVVAKVKYPEENRTETKYMYIRSGDLLFSKMQRDANVFPLSDQETLLNSLAHYFGKPYNTDVPLMDLAYYDNNRPGLRDIVLIKPFENPAAEIEICLQEIEVVSEQSFLTEKLEANVSQRNDSYPAVSLGTIKEALKYK